MVAVPIPHPSQSSEAYRARFQESFSEPYIPRDYGYSRQGASSYSAPEPAAEPVQPMYVEPAQDTVDAADKATQALSDLLKEQDWVNILAAGTLVAGGAMLIAGHKRAGLMVAAAGAGLALMEEKEAIEGLWRKLPGYLREAQSFLDNAEGYLQDAKLRG